MIKAPRAQTNDAGEEDTPPAAVSCSNVCMGYGGGWVLDHVTLEIPEGSFLPFVGPNGGGKTTLLRGILGLITPERGEIRFGKPGLQLGYVPQQKSIDPLFPVPLDHVVRMGLHRSLGWWRRPNKAQHAAVEQALEELGLGPHAHKNYRDLSGGLKQKGLIARALVSGADILVLDEPTSELDTPSERDVIGHLVRLCKERGKTVLIACHGIQLAVAMSEEVCLVEHGQARIVKTADAGDFTAMGLLVDDPLNVGAGQGRGYA